MKCSRRVWDKDCRRFRDCSLPGRVEREGVCYCRIHDPVAIQEKNDLQRARQIAMRNHEGERARRSMAEAEACKGVPTELLTPGLLKSLLPDLSTVKDEV